MKISEKKKKAITNLSNASKVRSQKRNKSLTREVSTTSLSPEQIIQFIDDIQHLTRLSSSSKSKLISIKIPEGLLRLFRIKCESQKVAYQTQIKILMENWLRTP